MKQKAILAGALVLLLAGITFMVWDLFFRKPQASVNPYGYETVSPGAGDTLKPAYSETVPVIPGLHEIHGVACGPEDGIFVAGDKGVEIFNREGKKEMAFPVDEPVLCIKAGNDGSIFLGMQDHVEIYNRQGKRLGRWKSCGVDALVTSIAGSGEDIYVADAGNRLVYRYDRKGNLLNRIGEKDPKKNVPGFIIPSPFFDVGVDPAGALWIANPGHYRLEKYSPDGDLLAAWGKASMATEGFCGCCNPTHFAFLHDGSFVTSEKGIERVKIYGPDGRFGCLVALPASFDEGTRGLDLAVDSKGRILVLDPVRNRVRIFIRKR